MALRRFFTNGKRITLTRKSSWADLSPYFAREEIFSPDTLPLMSPINLEALKKINMLREFLSSPLLINHDEHVHRGVRSPREQMELVKSHGAAMNSMHVAGMAFDVTAPKLDQQVLLEAAIAMSWTTLIVYDTFIHMDTRNSWVLGGQALGAVIRPLIIDKRTPKTKGKYDLDPFIQMANSEKGNKGSGDGSD